MDEMHFGDNTLEEAIALDRVIRRNARATPPLADDAPEQAPDRAAVFKEIRAFAKANKLRRKVSLRELRRMTAEGRD